ncbi:MAG: alpha-galactosidase [Clostridia bacterium]|nr:alpha-galactosidase [Clostridia bacterium]
MAKFIFGELELSTKTENPLTSENIICTQKGEIAKFSLDIDFGKKIMPSEYTVSWTMPQIDTVAFWSPRHHFDVYLKPDWEKNRSRSSLASGMPVCALVSKKGENRATVYADELKLPVCLAAGVVEETGDLVYEIQLFSEPTAKMKEYHFDFTIDTRPLPFIDTVKDARAHWESIGYKYAYTPRDARVPLYSTWYSFHQRTIPDEILEECRVARALGMETLIVDDGWQTSDNSRGYGYCGDWEVASDKIPDMKKFVDGVHDLGMKFMLWFSVPFVGCHSKNFERFKGMYLSKRLTTNTMVLDPRFSEVRDFIAGIYERFMLDYGVDGFKLDFIDSFRLGEESSEEYDKMTTSSVDEAVELLLDEISRRLKAINPEVLIEFRQSYVGPAIGKYGNMFRVCDCPNDVLVNRTHSLTMRLTQGKGAVHSDMLMWNKNEKDEALMHQLLSIMFCVPQISVRFDNITEGHKKILANYLDFWCKHSETILDGEIDFEGLDANYTIASAYKDGEKITVLYQGVALEIDTSIKNYVFNASGNDAVYLDLSGSASYEIYDMYGNNDEQGTLAGGACRLNVPNGGMIKII